MPGKYQIEAVFSITASVEPQNGYVTGIDDAEGVSDYEDSSSWYGESVTIEGGTVEFVVEADSEDEARDKATDIVDRAYFSGDDLDWEISDMSISEVTVIEPPMDMEKAMTLLRAVLDRLVVNGQVNAEEQAAFLFILEKVVAA